MARLPRHPELIKARAALWCSGLTFAASERAYRVAHQLNRGAVALRNVAAVATSRVCVVCSQAILLPREGLTACSPRCQTILDAHPIVACPDCSRGQRVSYEPGRNRYAAACERCGCACVWELPDDFMK
jgi:hypothetical protein